MRDLLSCIDSWSRRAPERLAHVSPSGRLSYGELGRGSAAVAAVVQDALPDDRSPVVVIGHKEPEMLIAFLGSARAGHPYVPIDISIPSHRIRQVIQTAGARLTLTVETIREAIELARTPRPVSLAPSDPFYVMFTSGSTGEPKGVTITLGCLTSFVEWMLAEHCFRLGGEVFLNQAPFSFDLSIMDTYLSLVTGGTLVSLTSDEIANPRQLFEALRLSGVTTWVSTPSFAQLCVAEPTFGGEMLPSLRRFLFCGETLPSHLAAQLVERFPETAVWNTYGPTEATVATTSIRIDRTVLERYPVLPVGRPKPDSTVRIVDSEDQLVLHGQRGEIIIVGPHVSPGYLNRPDLSKRRFFKLDGVQAYRTGDRGHFEDDLLFFDGRVDSQVKLHGYRVELGDVEANLRQVTGVCDAIVIPLERNHQIHALAAFVVGSHDLVPDDFESAQRIRRALAERLPSYMVPRVVRLVSSLPMTANGKVDRRKLAQEFTG